MGFISKIQSVMKYSIILVDRISFLEKQIKMRYLFLFVILFSSFFTLVGYTIGSLSNHPNKLERLVYDEKIILSKYNEPFSEESLEKLLKKLHVNHIDIVMNQSRIETGHYKSKVFLENNNLFGMREAKSRITTATGSNLNHATYDSWQESVIDYAIYQSTFLKGKNRNEYLGYLRANYAENKGYVSLIQKMK